MRLSLRNGQPSEKDFLAIILFLSDMCCPGRVCAGVGGGLFHREEPVRSQVA